MLPRSYIPASCLLDTPNAVSARGSTLSVNTSFVSWNNESTAAFFSSRERPRFLLCDCIVSASKHGTQPAQQVATLRTILHTYHTTPYARCIKCLSWRQLQDFRHVSTCFL